MRLNPKMVALLSVVSGIMAFVLISGTLNKATVETVVIEIVTATADMNVGDTITEEKVKLAPSPAGIDLEVTFRDPHMVIGKMLKNSIRAGKPVLTYDIADEEEDVFALIPEGYRASTISASMPTELIELLKFGVRVDVLFTDTSSEVLNTKTIMRNVLVMKVIENKGGGNMMMGGGRQQEVYVTLAVPPEAVETLSYAGRKGKLDLSILPYGARDIKEAYMSMEDLLDRHQAAEPNLSNFPSPIEIEVIKGTKKYMVEI